MNTRAWWVCGLMVALLGCGGSSSPGGGGGPIAPAPVVTSVTLAPLTAGTVYIGSPVQFQARETLSDGTTRLATNPVWGSDAPSVATVSTTGVVTPLAAGNATIYADSGMRGTLLVRVFPQFGGVWTGDETLAACQGTGDFRDVCREFTLGTVYYHYSTMTQNEAAVSSVLDAGDGATATLQGTVAVGGELTLGPGLMLPFDARAEVQNWRSRADQPGRMTGSYRVEVTVPDLVGSFVFDMQLQDLRRTPSATQSVQRDGERRRPAAAAIAEGLGRIRSRR